MTGRHSGNKNRRGPLGIPNRVRTGIIIAVTGVWVINFVASLSVKGYSPAPEINLAFMLVVGAVTASYRNEDN